MNVSLFRFTVTMYEENRPYEDLEDEDVVKSSLPQKVRDLAIPEVK